MLYRIQNGVFDSLLACFGNCSTIFNMTTKRPRVAPPSVDDILHFARIIMHDDPFKDRAPKEEDRHFRALFGCCADVALILWYRLTQHDLLPENGTMTHMLWTLLYCKNYPKWKTMTRLTGGKDPKTLRHWIGLFRESIEQLEGAVVSFMLFIYVYFVYLFIF